MLNLSNFTLHSQFNNLSRTLVYFPLCSQNRVTIPSKNLDFLNFGYVPAKIPSGFCLSASKNQRKGDTNVTEMEKFDEEHDEDEEVLGSSDEDFDDTEFVGDDDEVIIPLNNMKKWLENKPVGFGEGKVYDTSIEDNLMEEIEKNRKAQIVNVSKLKIIPGKPLSKKNEPVEKSKDVEEGYRVRLVNLPKKKNIHKDLRLAFGGVLGLISIVPAVYGNKKTRDPVCKGLAFVNFKSENEALRFVQTFSGQSIAFGKVQKQIKCELVKSVISIPAHEQSIDAKYSAPRLEQLSLDENPDAKSEKNVPHVTPSEELSSDEDKHGIREHPAESSLSGAVCEEEDDKVSQIDTKPFELEGEHFEKNMGTSEVDVEAIEQPIPVPSQSKKQNKLPTNVKSDTPRRKKEKSSQLTIPGSSKRLRVREKAMLTDVFSKYVPQAALAIEERR